MDLDAPPNGIVPVLTMESTKDPKREGRDTGDWQLNTNLSKLVFEQTFFPDVDLFATAKNRQVEKFYCATPSAGKGTTGCLGIDAFAHSWKQFKCPYANPPWTELKKVLQKVKREAVEKLLLICPAYENML